jgi:hypothetical protein
MRTALTRYKNKWRRTFRLETLERRALLSVAKAPAIHATSQTHTSHVAALVAALPVTLIQGHVVLIRGTSGQFVQVPPGVSSFGGHGNAAPLGFVTFGNNEVETPTGQANPSLIITHGTALLNTQRGESILLAYTGTGQSAGRGKNLITLNGTVTGGTGRFSGITGTFAATGTAQVGRVSLNFQIRPTYPT